jgi:hypothetical protein
VGIASAVYAHLAGSSRVILVGGAPGHPRLARETRAGDIHLDIFDLRGADERGWLVQNSATKHRGADVVSACIDALEVAEGR